MIGYRLLIIKYNKKVNLLKSEETVGRMSNYQIRLSYVMDIMEGALKVLKQANDSYHISTLKIHY